MAFDSVGQIGRLLRDSSSGHLDIASDAGHLLRYPYAAESFELSWSGAFVIEYGANYEFTWTPAAISSPKSCSMSTITAANPNNSVTSYYFVPNNGLPAGSSNCPVLYYGPDHCVRFIFYGTSGSLPVKVYNASIYYYKTGTSRSVVGEYSTNIQSTASITGQSNVRFRSYPSSVAVSLPS